MFTTAAYAARVQALEDEGLTTSDAQACADAELANTERREAEIFAALCALCVKLNPRGRRILYAYHASAL